MKRLFLGPALALLPSCSLSLSLFLHLYGQARHFDCLQHSPLFSFRSFILLFFLALFATTAIWLITTFFIHQLTGAKFSDIWRLNLLSFLPWLLFSLAPLALRHFLTQPDFLTRLRLLAGTILVTSIIIQIIIGVEKRREARKELRLLSRWASLSLATKAVVLFSVALLVYAAAAFVVQKKGVTFSGDEPHYLLLTHSLIVDHDFDLANNYQQRDYQLFMGEGFIIQPHTVPGAKKNSLLSFHSPGTSFLSLPFYYLGLKIGGPTFPLLLRLAMAVWGALFCLQLFLFIRENGWGEPLALRVWAYVSFTTPILFYSIHVYPEISAACLSFLVFRWFYRSDSFSCFRLSLSGFLLSLLFWFHSLKYLFLMMPLLLYGLWFILRKKPWLKNLSLFLGTFFLGAGAYFWFQKALYGSFNPTAVSWQGAMTSEQSLSFLKTILFSIPFRFRWETLAGYFLDQKDGLLFYAPVYFLSFVGLIAMLRRQPKPALLFLFLTWPYFLNSAFLTQRTGYAPQARPLVASFWGFALWLGYFLWTNQKKALSFLARVAALFSFLISILLIFNPFCLYQETTQGATERGGGLFYLFSKLHYSLPRLLPSFL